MDRSEVAARVESLLPVGVRPRQLSVRALLTGMLLTQADHRPAHLTRVHQALLGLCEDDRARLGIVARWPSGPHTLTYRQVEYTFGLVDAALARTTPSGAPSEALAGVADALLEASVPEACKGASSSYAVDWTDHETFSCPPVETGGDCADPEASWGHRRGDGPGQRDELFFGYYLQVATMVRKEDGPPVPELARRILLTSCHIDPPPAFLSVMASMAASGVVVGDVLGDSGYAHRVAANWALPLRQMGASLVMDLHPTDRGPKGTFAGATISNGNLYCPMTPTALLGMAPLARGATKEETAAHDRKTAEASHYKLGRISATDSDGYHRVACPATRGKVRCPLRPSSMAASHERPEVLTPPENPPTCCTQATVTVPPVVNAKTAQKHDYPGASWRASYARRSAAERTNSTVKDPASNDTTRGWCRLMGLSAITLFLACTFIVRNERVLVAFSAREREDARRAGRGLEPKTRRRRRKTLADLAEGAPA
ncbi:MAG: hypothetical protein ACRD0L_00560 [Acidimicrobiales bacterium]